VIQEHKTIGKEVTAVDRSLPAVMLLESCDQPQKIAVKKFGKLLTSASEREKMIGAAEKESAEGGNLEQVKRNKILNRDAIFISLFCTNFP
jgi:hypothetical protein